MASETPEKQDSASATLAHDRAAIDAFVEGMLAKLEALGYESSSVFAVRLAFEEAIANAFRHGHATLPEDTPIDVEYEIGADSVRISVEDRGPGFDPEEVPDPTLDVNLDKPSGRGLMLMRAYMSDVSHNESGNRVIMVYDRPKAG